jgi:hypothetical protein
VITRGETLFTWGWTSPQPRRALGEDREPQPAEVQRLREAEDLAAAAGRGAEVRQGLGAPASVRRRRRWAAADAAALRAGLILRRGRGGHSRPLWSLMRPAAANNVWNCLNCLDSLSQRWLRCHLVDADERAVADDRQVRRGEVPDLSRA